MATDTRPSVTVIGFLSAAENYGTVEFWNVGLDDLPGIGLQDGDEVEVTIRKHTRTTGNFGTDAEARRDTEG